MISYAPKALNIPLFLSKRLKQKPKNDKLIEHIQKQPVYQNCESRFIENISKKEQEKALKTQCKERQRLTANRSLITDLSFHLPPNRYNPKFHDIKREGEKGVHWSKLQRKPETIVHHTKNTKFLGNHKFYDIATNNGKCDKYKYTFNSNPRGKKPTSRNMIIDPILCYRNPNEPGPANYFPQNYSFQKNISPKKSAKPSIIYRFCPNSIVPQKEFYLDKQLNGTSPGPGRYNPVSIIAQPVKHCLYLPNMAYAAEMEAIKKFRHLPNKKVNRNFCEDPRLRVIPGHGHTYNFRDEENWKPKSVETSKKPSSQSNDRPMFLTLNYLNMINNPSRKAISVRAEDDEFKPKTKEIKVVYNCIAKPIIRKKTKENQKIAFMSGVPRWSSETTQPTVKNFDDKRKTLKKTSSMEIKKKKIDKYSKVTSRLQQIPDRLKARTQIIREKFFAFSSIPEPRILIRDNEIGSYGSKLLPKYTKQTQLENFFST